MIFYKGPYWCFFWFRLFGFYVLRNLFGYMEPSQKADAEVALLFLENHDQGSLKCLISSARYFDTLPGLHYPVWLHWGKATKEERTNLVDRQTDGWMDGRTDRQMDATGNTPVDALANR